ncbi:hypothetical protein [Acinetobacter junii]|uniref:hypothetical protein n=1 Tax=Acinetobacter junii TaxID=40215 RepID=UPI0024481644|nr:hypothetical protein [Acinetobacter junii]MDH0718198.1 hypothetical protein [Acinetobacter junii]
MLNFEKEREALDEKVILPDSSEAAWPINVTAWQSKTGHIYLDERIARYDGSTHSLCKRGHLYRKQSYCEECIPYENKEKYASFPTQQWKDEPLYSMTLDQWFFDKKSVFDVLQETGESAQELMLVICVPQMAYEIDPEDFYDEHLPDGINVPDEIAAAFESLNNAIRNCGNPLCYYPSNIAATVKEE